MHLIYLDESGNTGKDLSNTRQPIHFISGLIIHENSIDDLNKKIRNIYKLFSGSEKIRKFELHGGDMALGKGIFSEFDEGLRMEAFRKSIDIIAKSDVVFVSQGIDKKKLSEKYKAPLHPHNLAFMYLVEKIDSYLEEKESRGLLIMDNNEDRKQRVINDFSAFKEKSTFFGYGKKNIRNIIDSVYYTESHNAALIQLADVIGYLYAYLQVSKYKRKFDSTSDQKKKIFLYLEKTLAKKTYHASIKPR